jgi:hypothetical protein
VTVDTALVLILVGGFGVCAFAVPAVVMAGTARKVFFSLLTASATLVVAAIVYILVISSMVGA